MVSIAHPWPLNLWFGLILAAVWIVLIVFSYFMGKE
jgi:hypothetical protein